MLVPLVFVFLSVHTLQIVSLAYVFGESYNLQFSYILQATFAKEINKVVF